MLLPILLLAQLASSHTLPTPRPRRVCASILVAPAEPMAAERLRLRTPDQTAAYVREATLEEFRLYARLSNVRTIIDHQGRPRRLAQLGGRTVFLKSYEPWEPKIEVRGARISKLRREAIFLKILDDLELGPRFLGVVRLDRRPTLVMEYLPDAIFFKKDQTPFPPRRAPPQQKAVVRDQLEHLVETLHRHGIMAYDLQILITNTGRVVVIDTAQYRLYDEEPRAWRTPQTAFTEAALAQLFSPGGT